MKKILFVFFILFVFASSLLAGELYNCIDREGNRIITSSPQDGMKNCVLKDSFKDPTPQERARGSNINEQRKSQYNRETEASNRNLERSRIQSKITDKKKELQDILSRFSLARDLNEKSRYALEAASIKGEINRLQQQDPNYRPDPNAGIKSRIDDLEFELEQEKFRRQMDKLGK